MVAEAASGDLSLAVSGLDFLFIERSYSGPKSTRVNSGKKLTQTQIAENDQYNHNDTDDVKYVVHTCNLLYGYSPMYERLSLLGTLSSPVDEMSWAPARSKISLARLVSVLSSEC
ncbi:MAG TPA: hypothetical protein VJ864_01480, partial [Candidatus Binatia bacterium]|nr:hypothetical protein [Candidatus Binatia bacterium]